MFRVSSLKRNGPKILRHFIQCKLYSKELKTALFFLHEKYGGKMINFGGYTLPVSYRDQSVSESHIYTRRFGSIFDVSHMLQTYVYGKDAVDLIESLCPADLKNLNNNRAVLTVFTNEQGNILDDLIVTKIRNDLLYIVSNATTRSQDKKILQSTLSHYRKNGKDVALEFFDTNEKTLIAVQGPQSVTVLKKLLPQTSNIDGLKFMHSKICKLAGVSNCRITRCGYTGEDGVEIFIPSDSAEQITEALLNVEVFGKKLKLSGLAARDTLRLEAGLCLYGTDINDQTSLVEAGLSWLISRRRKLEMNFPGARYILSEIQNKVNRVRVGFQMINQKMPIPRHGVEIFKDGLNVGIITSGALSPCLKKNIAMGYINVNLKHPGTAVQFKIRGNLYDAFVVNMPFIQTKYFI